jgi:hypothetical protein
MANFFGFASLVGTALFLAALGLGHFSAALGAQPFHHLVLGLTAAIWSVSLHCLVFGIFTGAGKDTRLLVEDLRLSPDFVKRMKAFKFKVFPPALYAILAILVVTSLGGALSAKSAGWLRWLHFGCAWLVFFYNTKVLRMEWRAIRENGELLRRVNEEAARHAVPSASPQYREVAVLADAAEQFDWGTHVFAFGRFLTFLAYNTWLPYLYLRFIVGYVRMPWWPYLALSAALYLAGSYLKLRYRDFRPGLPGSSVLAQG